MSESQTKTAIAACIAAIAYKYATEEGAGISQLDGVTRIRHARAIEHPWPRAFSYHIELLAAGDLPAVWPAIASLPDVGHEEHVVNLFTDDKVETVNAGMKLGYRHAWSNVLLLCDLSDQSAAPSDESDVEISAVQTVAEVEAINRLAPDYPTSVTSLTVPHVHNFMAKLDGHPAAKAQLLTLPGDVAYAADMFTAPAARRKGLARALLQHLHEVARFQGAKQVVLIPSLMTREIRFYQRLGYREISPLMVLAPAEPPDLRSGNA